MADIMKTTAEGLLWCSVRTSLLCSESCSMYRHISGKDAEQYSALQAIINDMLYLKPQHLIAPSDFPFIPHSTTVSATQQNHVLRNDSHLTIIKKETQINGAHILFVSKYTHTPQEGHPYVPTFLGHFQNEVLCSYISLQLKPFPPTRCSESTS